MSKEKAIEKIQYSAMQIASVYACSVIFDEKTKVIEGRQKVLEKAIVNLHDALKELEEWYENLEAISICVTYDSYMYYRIRNWKFFVAFNHTSNMGNNRKYYITGESN